MTDLPAFLAARLDEDEQGLRELTRIGERKRDQITPADFEAAIPGFMALMSDPDMAAMIRRQTELGYRAPNDVQRIHREIEAKRAILAEYEEDMVKYGYSNALEWALGHLAAVYSDHPDYDPEWAPS